VACHEDLTGSDLVGRYLIKGDETVWIDGPLTRAVREGAVCYLDEIVEARKDTIVLIHPLTDHRRILPVDKTGEILEAHPDFLLVLSYNPGYQSVLKDLKPSTRQRFVAIDFDYPARDLEARVVAHESGIDLDEAMRLAKLGEKVRHLKSSGLAETYCEATAPLVGTADDATLAAAGAAAAALHADGGWRGERVAQAFLAALPGAVTILDAAELGPWGRIARALRAGLDEGLYF